ncbi:olfactory receptor 5J3-like [Ambystoma mexicanum]|uniref:olfactory receptor 5J3-like n=1 Tax=Ambystoma mexicanum TaxID=8296 RepID=UPI0037E702F9
MEDANGTMDFLILGFSEVPQLKGPLFGVFLVIYLAILTGNLLIVTAVYITPRLYTPMYFFLTNLSFLDMFSSTIIFPKMLADFYLESPRISLFQCLAQMHIFIAMIGVEFFLLTVMAFDRYAAICNPLHYMSTMSRNACIQLSVGSWTVGIIAPTPYTVIASRLSFCRSHQVNHFFCDVTALLDLSCTNTRHVETLNYVCAAVVATTTLGFILASYINIISAIVNMKSKDGGQKAFSTCASHLTVVILFYGALFFMYIRPPSMYSVEQNKLLSLLYIALTPLCNPIVYSLKNQELKRTLLKATCMQVMRER